jgi:Kef-type K+ transport system membrane component KefB
LIALTAGGEFIYKRIKLQFKTIISVIIWQIMVVIIGFLIFVLLYKNNISFIKDNSITAVLGVGIILGAISIAKSPATTIAVITETKSKGKFTDFILGVTLFKDVVVVLVFSLALSVAKPLIIPEHQLELGYIISVLIEITLSIIVGIASGWIILLYIKNIKAQTALFLLAFMILGIELSKMLHLEFILVFMVAGFFVQNFSSQGEKLILGLEESSLPIFVTFFAIAGASLNFPILIDNWLLAIFIVGIRLLTTWGGTYIGGRLTGADANIKNLGWMGFIGQAGLSLGLSVLVKQNFPGEIGLSIATLIIASIAINQIIGPILFRISLAKVGEINTSGK